METPRPDGELRARLLVLIESFQRLTGRALLDEPIPEGLWRAPRAVVAHGTEDDPVFFYGNALALNAFAMDFYNFTRLPGPPECVSS